MSRTGSGGRPVPTEDGLLSTAFDGIGAPSEPSGPQRNEGRAPASTSTLSAGSCAVPPYARRS